MRRTNKYASPDGHEESNDAEQSEGIAQEGVPEVDGSFEELNSRPFLNREERGSNQRAGESIKNQEVHEAGIRITELAALAEYFNQETGNPLGDAVQPVFFAAEMP